MSTPLQNGIQGESMIRTSRNKNSAPAGGDPKLAQQRGLQEGADEAQSGASAGPRGAHGGGLNTH